MKASQSTKFERLLFTSSRILALLFAAIAVILLVIVGINALRDSKEPRITIEDIKSDTSSISDVDSPEDDALEFPPKIKEYLFDRNESIFLGWLESIDGEESKQEFIDNLNEIIVEGEKQELKIADLINSYHTMKMERLASSSDEGIESMIEKSAIAFLVFGLVIFIVLMTLVLVALAIERNTRIPHGGIARDASSPPPPFGQA
jgi:hypothetical protein